MAAEFVFASAGETLTLELGIRLGRLLTQPALILLQGELGAGKSVLARGIARGLGVPETVPITSPTFTLMNQYAARLPLYHFDLYRLNDPDELIELGFADYVDGDGVALVEWPERIGPRRPDGLLVTLSYAGEERRELRFSACGEAAEALLEGLREGLAKLPLNAAKR